MSTRTQAQQYLTYHGHSIADGQYDLVRDNCAACQFRKCVDRFGIVQQAPNVAGWARTVVQAGLMVRPSVLEDHIKECDNDGYLSHLMRDLQSFSTDPAFDTRYGASEFGDPSAEDVFDASGERGGLNADWVHTVWAIRDIAEGTVFIFDEEDDTYSVIVRDMSDGDFEWCEPLLTSDNADLVLEFAKRTTASVDVDQNWDAETTTYTFEDGSKIEVSSTEYLVIGVA